MTRSQTLEMVSPPIICIKIDQPMEGRHILKTISIGHRVHGEFGHGGLVLLYYM